MNYNDIPQFRDSYGKYMPQGIPSVVIPIPTEDEEPIVTDFVIDGTVTFDNGGSGRYVTATVAPEGLERYDNQTISNATAVLNTGDETLQMWVTMILSNGSATMEMDFSEVENPDVLEGISTVVSANLTWGDGGSTEAVTFTMTADLVLPEPAPTPTVDRNYLCFQNVEAVNNTITLEKQGEPTYDVTCEYTKDGSTWTVMNLTPDENGICDSIVLQPNEKVYLRGTGTWEIEGSGNSWSQYYFQSTGLLDMSGNLLSIWDKATFDTMTQMPNNTTMYFLQKYGTTAKSHLKVRNADLSFDKIVTVSQTNASKPNRCVISSLFAGLPVSPNIYLQSCKIHFDSQITVRQMSGSYTFCPFANFFAYCANITEVWLPDWTGTGSWGQTNFLQGVTTEGTIYLPKGKSISTGTTIRPTKWTVKHYDPTTGEVID